MGDLSFSEILVIVLSIIILFGPKKIPEIARELGQGIRKMRSAVEEIKQEIMKETDDSLSDLKKDIEEAKEKINELNPVNQLKEYSENIPNWEEEKDNGFSETKKDKNGPVSR